MARLRFRIRSLLAGTAAIALVCGLIADGSRSGVPPALGALALLLFALVLAPLVVPALLLARLTTRDSHTRSIWRPPPLRPLRSSEDRSASPEGDDPGEWPDG